MEEFAFESARWFMIVRTVFLILDVLLLGVFVYAFTRTLDFRPKFLVNPAKTKQRIARQKDARIEERWKSVMDKFNAGTSDSVRLSIIEADGVIGEALEGMGLPGEHFAEKLSSLRVDNMASFDRVWHSHRLRNKLVHTPGSVVSNEEARLALEGYEMFLKELKLL